MVPRTKPKSPKSPPRQTLITASKEEIDVRRRRAGALNFKITAVSVFGTSMFTMEYSENAESTRFSLLRTEAFYDISNASLYKLLEGRRPAISPSERNS